MFVQIQRSLVGLSGAIELSPDLAQSADEAVHVRVVGARPDRLLQSLDAA